MLHKVDFMSEREAVMLAGKHNHGFVSMTDANRHTKLQADQWGAFIHLAVDDITIPREGWVRFEATHATLLLDWLDENVPTLTTIHVHCHQGISRSAAVARFIAKTYDLDFDEGRGMLYNRHIYNELFAAAKERKDQCQK